MPPVLHPLNVTLTSYRRRVHYFWLRVNGAPGFISFYVLLLLYFRPGVGRVSSSDNCSQVETSPQIPPAPPRPRCSRVTSQGSGIITQSASAEGALLCCITFINHRAGSFSVTPSCSTARLSLAAPAYRTPPQTEVYFSTYLL